MLWWQNQLTTIVIAYPPGSAAYNAKIATSSKCPTRNGKVSIPYQAILYHFGWDISKDVAYLVRYMPLIRGGYAMAIVVSWFTYNKATGLFFTYLITLFSTVYFASLTFYLFEFKVNPDVKCYQDALWWAAMDVTTVGSNIEAVTGVGRVLSVLLAALGMMMFPIFTVYVTNLITERNKQAGTHNDEISL